MHGSTPPLPAFASREVMVHVRVVNAWSVKMRIGTCNWSARVPNGLEIGLMDSRNQRRPGQRWRGGKTNTNVAYW